MSTLCTLHPEEAPQGTVSGHWLRDASLSSSCHILNQKEAFAIVFPASLCFSPLSFNGYRQKQTPFLSDWTKWGCFKSHVPSPRIKRSFGFMNIVCTRTQCVLVIISRWAVSDTIPGHQLHTTPALDGWRPSRGYVIGAAQYCPIIVLIYDYGPLKDLRLLLTVVTAPVQLRQSRPDVEVTWVGSTALEQQWMASVH